MANGVMAISGALAYVGAGMWRWLSCNQLKSGNIMWDVNENVKIIGVKMKYQKMK